MEVSKFKIGGDIIDIKDAQARDDVIAAMNAAQDAQSTADQKQDAATALKCGQASKTFTNVTINAFTDHQFIIPLPDGITNVKGVFARATSYSLPCSSMYRVGNNMNVYLMNATNANMTASSITVEVTYLYV